MIKKVLNSVARLGVFIILLDVPSACFTGVESTPKITENDLKKQVPVNSEETDYLAGIKHQPLNDWTSGKQFLVTDNKISLLLGPEMNHTENLHGKIIRFQQAEDVTSVTGTPIAQLSFMTPDSSIIKMNMDKSVADLSKRDMVEIPFTIELSIVEDVKDKLQGQKYFIVTREWCDTANIPKSGHRFVPVEVNDVRPGNSFYPILLVMKDENGQPFHLFMSVGKDPKAPRSFASLFSLTNPRLRYPAITDKTWQNIINGTVAQEMTREECRLAIGAPANIDRRPGYSILTEIWSYENGRYLIFEDGLLRSFRL